MRRSFSFLWALLLSVFLFGCAKEPEVAPKQVNPRLAKSGKKLVKELELAIAPDSSKSLNAKPKADNDAVRKDGAKSGGIEAGVVPEPASPAIPTQAERQQLIRQAQAGDANAQVDLGNIFFGGRGVPANKKAAEFWWRKALASRHPSAIQNLQMLYTKPEEGMSFFGTVSKGNRLVFVIDKSGSMRKLSGQENRLDKAKRELKRTLQTLSPSMEFFIYFYDGVELPMPGGKLLKATRYRPPVTFGDLDTDAENQRTPGALMIISLVPCTTRLKLMRVVISRWLIRCLLIHKRVFQR